MKHRIVAKSLGALVLVIALGGAGPLVADWLAGWPVAPWWAMIALMAAVGGGLLIAGRHAQGHDLRLREGMAITVLAWTLISLLAGTGLWLACPPLGFVEAWFEAVSGVTTTGSTVFGGERPVEGLSPGLLLWRSQLQWIGGIGIVVISLALLPLMVGGSSSYAAFRAEVPGLTAERLAPQMRQTAVILYRFYLALTAAVFLGLLACGVGGFDALCHAMTCVSTGGFSTHGDSVEGFGSAGAEWVVIAGMLIAGTNFGLLLQCLHGRPLRLLRSGEFRLYLTLLIGASIALAITLAASSPAYGHHLHDLVRDSVFQAVAIGTTTGYSSGFDTLDASYADWPQLAQMILVALMIGGGCAGSTAGGIKLVRFLVALRAARRELRRYVEPARVTPVRLGGHELNEAMVLQVGTFLMLFFLSWLAGSLVLLALGSDLATACTAALSCLSNIGPGLGAVGPDCHWAHLGPAAHLMGIVLMIVGRLELLGVLLMLHPAQWRR